MQRTLVQNVARLVGIVFLLVGIAGFIPGVTTNLYDGLEFAGNDGTAELLGIFQVSVLHNIVHGLFGLAGLALAATPSGARTYLIGGGAIYLALFVIGWILQFIGHYYEGKPPEFFKDYRFLFVGLRWWFKKIVGVK